MEVIEMVVETKKANDVETKYGRIKVKQFEFESLLKYARCKGKVSETKAKSDVPLLKEALVNCNNDGVRIYGTDENGIVYVDVMLKNNAQQVVDDGVIPVMDINQAIDQVGRFNTNDILLVYVENGKLVMQRQTPYKHAKTPTCTPNSITSMNSNTIETRDKWTFKGIDEGYISKNGTKLDVIVKTNAQFLKELVNDEGFVDRLKFPLNATSGKFKVKIGTEDSTEVCTEVVCTEVKGESETTMSYGFCNILNAVDNNVVIYMCSIKNAPIWVRQETDKFVLQYNISPYVE